MTGLLRTVPVIPTFGTCRRDTRHVRAENPTRRNNSDSEDDSIRSGQPIGWDGWHDQGKSSSLRTAQVPLAADSLPDGREGSPGHGSLSSKRLAPPPGWCLYTTASPSVRDMYLLSDTYRRA